MKYAPETIMTAWEFFLTCSNLPGSSSEESQREMNLEDEVFDKCIVFFSKIKPQIKFHFKVGKRVKLLKY